MVDRIEKLDPKHYRVDEMADEHQGQGRQAEGEEEKEPKEKDRFNKGQPVLKKLIEKGGSAEGRFDQEEASLSFSQRVLVLWGILDLTGKPRLPVILGYVIITSVILVSAGLILGLLWR